MGPKCWIFLIYAHSWTAFVRSRTRDRFPPNAQHASLPLYGCGRIKYKAFAASKLDDRLKTNAFNSRLELYDNCHQQYNGYLIRIMAMTLTFWITAQMKHHVSTKIMQAILGTPINRTPWISFGRTKMDREKCATLSWFLRNIYNLSCNYDDNASYKYDDYCHYVLRRRRLLLIIIITTAATTRILKRARNAFNNGFLSVALYEGKASPRASV